MTHIENVKLFTYSLSFTTAGLFLQQALAFPTHSINVFKKLRKEHYSYYLQIWLHLAANVLALFVRKVV